MPNDVIGLGGVGGLIAELAPNAMMEFKSMSSLKELQDLIQEKYDIDPATLDANASMREHGIDSLTLVEFIFTIEDHFGIRFPDSRTDIDTLAALAEVIDEIRAAKPA
jgi:acyl carrier protein